MQGSEHVLSIDRLVDGFPGKSYSHGSFGWSSVWLLCDEDRVILVETGPPSYVPLLNAALAERGLSPSDVTDVLVTHAHWDHLANIDMFRSARLWIGADELLWAAGVAPGTPFVSLPHVRDLARRGDEVGRVRDGEMFLPGITAIATPGHTPGHIAYFAQTNPPVIFAGDAIKNLYEAATAEVDSTMDGPASTASVWALRAQMFKAGALLIPGHDVALECHHGSVRRIALQQARISVFPTVDSGEQMRTIEVSAPADSGGNIV